MKRIQLGNSELSVPVISLGCMVMHQSTKEEANKVIHNALEHGIDFLIMLIFMEKENLNQYLQKRLK